jgi:hypothetical protein
MAGEGPARMPADEALETHGCCILGSGARRWHVRFAAIAVGLWLLASTATAETASTSASIVVLRGAHVSLDTPLEQACSPCVGGDVAVLRGASASLVPTSRTHRGETPLALADPPPPPPPVRKDPEPVRAAPALDDRYEPAAYDPYEPYDDGESSYWSTSWGAYGIPLASHWRYRHHRKHGSHLKKGRRHEGGSSIRLDVGFGSSSRSSGHPPGRHGSHGGRGRGSHQQMRGRQ